MSYIGQHPLDPLGSQPHEPLLVTVPLPQPTGADALCDAVAGAMEAGWFAGANDAMPSPWPDLASRVLADPAVRAALVAGIAEALGPYEMPDVWTDGLRSIVMAGSAAECAAALVDRLLPPGGA